MRPPFPGMDPWLERSELWPNVHNSLIAAIRDHLAPLVRPRYFVGVESRTTLLSGPDVDRIYEPDVVVHVPVEEIEEIYLTIKELPGLRLVTVIEVLAPTNKKSKDARAEYLEKRGGLIRSRVNFVEIDLLRGGEPMPLIDPPPPNDYRILICRTRPRRKAVAFVFAWTTPIPTIPIPLLPGDAEPVIDLNSILHSLMDRAGYDLVINYRQPPHPPLRPEDKAWAAPILARALNETPETTAGEETTP